MNTIVDVANNEATTWENAKTAAASALQGAREAVGEHKEKLRRNGEDLSKKNAELAGVRQELATTPTPADGEALLDRFEAILVDVRRLAAERPDSLLALAGAESEAARAEADLARASASLASAKAALEEAKRAEALRVEWRSRVDALTVAPTLSKRASDLLATPTFAAARAVVESAIPKALLDSARLRATAAIAERDSARSAESDAEKRLAAASESLGPAGVAESRSLDFRRKEAALRSLALKAAADIEEARKAIERVAKEPPPSDAVKTRIAARTAEWAAGLTALTKRDEAHALVEAQKSEIAEKKAEIGEAGGPGADPALDGELAKLETDLAPLALDLAKAEAELPAGSIASKLDAIEAAVPDDLWALAFVLDGATRTLERLRAIDPSAIRQSATDAEKAYAEAIEKRLQDERKLVDLEAEIERARRVAEANEEVSGIRVLAALRGDR